MKENFSNAAKRHWKDGQLLHEQKRLDNADQLYGFAAECALKYALDSLGYFRPEAHRKHINELWNKMQATAFYGAANLAWSFSARSYFGIGRYLYSS